MYWLPAYQGLETVFRSVNWTVYSSVDKVIPGMGIPFGRGQSGEILMKYFLIISVKKIK